MICKLKTIDKIAESFTINTPPNIEREIDYKSINKIMQFLYANVATLPKPQRRGHHGHIRIIMKPMLYTNFSTMALINSNNPGVYPMVPMNSTVAHQDQLKIYNNEGKIIYNTAVMMGKALKNHVTNSVNDT